MTISRLIRPHTSGDVKVTPLLSIITPVYNGEKFILGCIESVVAQNCAGVEHIVVDGGSTDRTVQILREKAETHPHLRWISEPDSGQSDALNKGIALARAEYIGILNVDDFYEFGRSLSRRRHNQKPSQSPVSLSAPATCLRQATSSCT